MITREKYWSNAAAAADFLKQKGIERTDIVVQCGSGLSGLADALGTDITQVEMAEIPHFPDVSVAGHGKKAIHAVVEDKGILILTGRIHMYEGHSALQAGFPAALAAASGAKLFVVSNAAGGLNQHFNVGEVMIHRDFINFQHENAAAGMLVENPEQRFIDPKPAYHYEASELLAQELANAGLAVHGGTYIAVRGPMYETRAELAMLRGFGADAIGMSTVPEVTVCQLFGLPVAGVSIITNACFEPVETSHQSVLEQSNTVAPKLVAAFRSYIGSVSRVLN